MTKKAIKQVIKKHNKVIIPNSYFISDEGSHIFLTYDKDLGICEEWWICPKFKVARSQTLSSIVMHEQSDRTSLFF